MICPECKEQMHQYHAIGGGNAVDTQYETWEIKQCPRCGRKVLEYYSVLNFLSDDHIEELANGNSHPHITFEKY